DGVLNALLLVNAMADSKKTLGQLVAHLQSEFGQHHYGRVDLHINDELKQSAIRRAESPETSSIGAFKILRKENLDGVKLFLEGSSGPRDAQPWVLLRASGTEPLLRIYSEAASPELVREILSQAENFVSNSAVALAGRIR
ncbi:MAG TPA: hypothetical protein VG892_13140, partial [Terriglobales bacterium]|nr:hypothetical protein [Terriglobales bacterium]